MLDLLGPRHLADVDEALDARLELDERAVVGDRLDLAAGPSCPAGTPLRRGSTGSSCVCLRPSETRSVSGLYLRTRTVTSSPTWKSSDGWLTRPQLMSVMWSRPSMPPRSTKAPYSVMFLMTPLTTLPSSRVSSVLRLLLVALLLEEHAAREDDVAALLVELDDLELVGLPDQLVQVADGAEVDLRSGEERLHAAADGDRQAALHALADGPFDELVALARGRDLIPDLHLVCFLLGKHDEAVVVLAALDVDVDRVAGLDRGLALGVGELVQGDDALALAADVDDDVVALHGDDRALDDLAFFAEVAGADAGLEERGKACRRRLPMLPSVCACGAQGCGCGRHVLERVLGGPRCVAMHALWGLRFPGVQRADQCHAPRAGERNSLQDPLCQRGSARPTAQRAGSPHGAGMPVETCRLVRPADAVRVSVEVEAERSRAARAGRPRAGRQGGRDDDASSAGARPGPPPARPCWGSTLRETAPISFARGDIGGGRGVVVRVGEAGRDRVLGAGRQRKHDRSQVPPTAARPPSSCSTRTCFTRDGPSMRTTARACGSRSNAGRPKGCANASRARARAAPWAIDPRAPRQLEEGGVDGVALLVAVAHELAHAARSARDSRAGGRRRRRACAGSMSARTPRATSTSSPGGRSDVSGRDAQHELLGVAPWPRARASRRRPCSARARARARGGAAGHRPGPPARPSRARRRGARASCRRRPASGARRRVVLRRRRRRLPPQPRAARCGGASEGARARRAQRAHVVVRRRTCAAMRATVSSIADVRVVDERRVGGLAERRDGARRVLLVAAPDVVERLLEGDVAPFAPELVEAASRADLGPGGKEELHLGIRERRPCRCRAPRGRRRRRGRPAAADRAARRGQACAPRRCSRPCRCRARGWRRSRPRRRAGRARPGSASRSKAEPAPLDDGAREGADAPRRRSTGRRRASRRARRRGRSPRCRRGRSRARRRAGARRCSCRRRPGRRWRRWGDGGESLTGTFHSSTSMRAPRARSVATNLG